MIKEKDVFFGSYDSPYGMIRSEWKKSGNVHELNVEIPVNTTAVRYMPAKEGVIIRKGQKLYLHVFNYPANGKLGVPMSNKISKAYLLTDAKKQLKVNDEQSRSSIQLPAVLSDTMNTVVVVKFSGEPVVAPPLVRGKTITASSRASDDQPAQNLLDGKRQTEWRAAKGERRATLEIDLQKPVAVSSFIADEPWHLWEGKKQTLTLQYKVGNDWKTATEGTSNGTGFVRNFAPVTAQFFRLVIENKTGEPLLLEWQLYGPE